jgi:hypothetical protein
LNIEDLLQRIKFGIKNAGLIDFKIINNGKSYAINIDSKSELNNVDYTDYKLITEKGGKFKLKIEIKREKCTVNKITINDNMLTINIENGNVKNAYLVQRVYKDSSILLEDHFILLKNIGFHTYSLNLDSICQLSQYDNTTIYDFVFEINNELYSYYSFAYLNDDSLDIDTIANDQFTITPYVGKKGYLSINLTRRYHSIFVKDIVEDSNLISIKIENDNQTDFKALKAIMCSYNEIKVVNNNVEYVPYKELTIDFNQNDVIINLPKKIAESMNLYDEKRYRIILTDSYSDVRYLLSFKSQMNFTFPLENNVITIKGKKRLNVHIARNKVNTVKIGILGTCYSRHPFNSKKSYFNPDYKKLFSVEFTHFHPSVISLFDKSEYSFNDVDIDDVHPIRVADIKREIEKTILDELTQKDVDYLIIDFYVDAIEGIRRSKKSEGYSVVENVGLKSTNFSSDILLKETNQYDLRNKDFFNEWKTKCLLFIDILKKFIPEKRIILHSGGLSEFYFDKKGNIQNFKGETNYSLAKLNSYRAMWQKMNAFFLTNMPSAKLIDMERYELIADEKHPINKGPHHFQSAYYKAFLGELSKIVLFDIYNP